MGSACPEGKACWNSAREGNTSDVLFCCDILLGPWLSGSLRANGGQKLPLLTVLDWDCTGMCLGVRAGEPLSDCTCS